MTVPEQRFEGATQSSAAPGPKGGLPATGSAPPSPPTPPGNAAAHGPSAFAGRYSREGSDRQQGILRKLAAQFMGVPGVVSLSGGFPPADLFPFESISVTLRGGGQTVTIDDPGKVAAAQQYNLALRGYAPLLRWAEQHVRALHAPPAGHEVAITNGGNHTVEILVSLLCDRGDSILTEEYSYPHMLECVAAPKGLAVVGLPMDAQGIIPEAMEQVLEQLRRTPGARFPKLLYTIPTAQNPTGASITPVRRQAVYELCCRYDILIIEDDPYYYLQFPPSAAQQAQRAAQHAAQHGAQQAQGNGLPGGPCEAAAAGPAEPAAAGPCPLPAPLALLRWAGSYVGLDVEGRVARVDSFAKFMSPGLRLGWITAPPDLLDKVVMCLQAHTVGPCTLSQVVVAETLAAWGEEGLAAHVQRVQEAYARRAAVMVEAAQQELAGLADWEQPSGGMFLWMKLRWVGDATEVWADLQRHKLVVLPGRVMHARATDPTFLSPYVRISYSHASEDQIREGMRRLGQVLRERAAAAGAAGNGSGACGASAADGSVAVAVAAATRAVLGAANIASSS